MSAEDFCCLHCGGDRSEIVYRDCPDHYLRTPFLVDYFTCEDCGLIQQSPIPEDVAPFYDAYPIHEKKSPLYDLLRRLIMSPAYADTSSCPEGAVILDYGCGDGWYLESRRDKELSLVGFEAQAEQAERLSARLGLPVFGNVEALLREYAGAVDVVTMHFVMEHVTDLHSTFATVSKLLKPGGRFYMVVPNVSSWESRLFRRKWHGLDSPRHISFPDRRVTESLARRYGMKLLRERSVPFSNGVAGSLPVVLVGHFTFPLFLLFLPLGIVLSRLVPTGSRAFWLVRE